MLADVFTSRLSASSAARAARAHRNRRSTAAVRFSPCEAASTSTAARTSDASRMLTGTPPFERMGRLPLCNTISPALYYVTQCADACITVRDGSKVCSERALNPLPRFTNRGVRGDLVRCVGARCWRGLEGRGFVYGGRCRAEGRRPTECGVRPRLSDGMNGNRSHIGAHDARRAYQEGSTAMDYRESLRLIEARALAEQNGFQVRSVEAAGRRLWEMVTPDGQAITRKLSTENDGWREAGRLARLYISGPVDFLIATEFPDFDQRDMPEIPAGFVGSSWHNNSCPSFTMRLADNSELCIWIGDANPQARDFPDTKRFALQLYDADGDVRPTPAFPGDVESDNWQDIVRAVAFIIGDVHGAIAREAYATAAT